MKMLFIDTETGGLDPSKHSLLDIGMVATDNEKIIGTYQTYIKENEYIVAPEALEVNNLNLKEVKEKGKKYYAVIDDINCFIKNRFLDNKPVLVGHNVSFDFNFINTLFKKSGSNFNNLIIHRKIDTACLLLALYSANKIPFEACSSTGAFDYFNIEVKNRHTAIGDCLATYKLYFKILNLLKGNIDE